MNLVARTIWVLAGGHPFADLGFGLLVLVVIRGIDEVTAGGDEGV